SPNPPAIPLSTSIAFSHFFAYGTVIARSPPSLRRNEEDGAVTVETDIGHQVHFRSRQSVVLGLTRYADLEARRPVLSHFQAFQEIVQIPIRVFSIRVVRSAPQILELIRVAALVHIVIDCLHLYSRLASVVCRPNDWERIRWRHSGNGRGDRRGGISRGRRLRRGGPR